ncbi:uncharacterized protein LOC125720913 [Brienomyrus brachyistius]|uniref:uncharacterized protein LOC125720913 n=1 Tax=Brienomyrus brachyistius TaxID=42636 RepID=UPI0020B37DA4|nr:uncharacterized protein LOC125720913 [Brienomyrus brachyistius]
MMLRGGKGLKVSWAGTEIQAGLEAQTAGAEVEEAGASEGPIGTDGETMGEQSLAELPAIFRAFMGQQEAREARMSEEAARQEQRFKALQHQFQLLQLEVQARTSVPELLVTGPESQEVSEGLYPPPQAPGMLVPGRERVSTFTGQPRSFSDPKLEKLMDDDDVEHFLLTFERIAAACRWPKLDWVFRLLPLLTGKARSAYVQMDLDESNDYDCVKAAILRKYDINPEAYRQRFRSSEVGRGETPKELYVRLKELYNKWTQPHAARRKGEPWSYAAWKTARVSHRQTPAQYPQNPTSGGSKLLMRENQSASKQGKIPVCYLCGQDGHIKSRCPRNPAKLTQMCLVPCSEVKPMLGAHQTRSVKINGRPLKALIDSGSDQTLVQRQFVPTNAISLLETLPICCIHGDEKFYPTADVYIEVGGQVYLLTVGVADRLPFPVVLGRDMPVLFDLLSPIQNCNIVVTRARGKRVEEPPSTLSGLPFFGVDLETRPGKSRKPRTQRRREKFQHTVVNPPEGVAPDMLLGYEIPVNMVEMQHNDSSLAPFFPGVREGEARTEAGGQKGKVFPAERCVVSTAGVSSTVDGP